MRKIISSILALTILLCSFTIPVHGARVPEISPQYTDVSSCSLKLLIDETGCATVLITLSGNSGLEEVSISTHLERKVGGKWYLVYLGGTNTSWEDTFNSRSISLVHTADLSTTGTYRAVAEFTVTGTVTETFTKIAQSTY